MSVRIIEQRMQAKDYATPNEWLVNLHVLYEEINGYMDRDNLFLDDADIADFAMFKFHEYLLTGSVAVDMKGIGTRLIPGTELIFETPVPCILEVDASANWNVTASNEQGRWGFGVSIDGAIVNDMWVEPTMENNTGTLTTKVLVDPGPHRVQLVFHTESPDLQHSVTVRDASLIVLERRRG